ncbi:MAG: EboA domain-containing protein [Nannocystaceae bacterium]|nr:EboA domain-containing protein [bacterium]
MQGVGQGERALERMRELVAQHGVDGASAWLDEALETIRPDTLASVRVSLARSARRVGDAPLALEGAPHWTARDAARAAIVLRAFVCRPGEAATAYGQWLRRGDQGEQESLLRMPMLLPEPAAVLADTIDACRTNSEVVFRAIACRNPYPAAHFPELNFNQLVLKAIFMGVAVGEIDGLADRITPELLRMADDFASERRAAGRTVPEDIPRLHQLAARS